MLLVKKNVKEIPAGANVIANRNEVLAHQEEVLKNWKPQLDVFFIRWSPVIAAGAGAAGAFFFNSYYRKQLKLRHYGRVSTYLPNVIVPAMAIGMAHHVFVQKPLLLQEVPCPSCLQMRSLFLQTALGVVYPLVLAPLASFQMASNYNTFPVKSLFAAPKDMFNIWRAMTKKKSNTIIAIWMAQVVCAVFLAKFETWNMYKIIKKSLEQELKLEEGFDEDM